MTSNESRASEFIGRQQEMAVLTAALHDALSGRGQMVMLAGEPGIGKTRLAQELASRAESLGAQVLWGWCYEREGAPPYWPWAQPIRSYVQDTGADQLRSQMGPGGADIAEVIPEVRAKLPDLDMPAALDPEQARFRLFDSFATFFKNLAQTQPIMLVLDDLHWADKPSLLLLEFLVRQLAESRLLVLGTYRDAEVTREHPLSETLAQLYRSPVFHTTVLGGLESGAVGQFIQAAAGSEAPQDLIDAIYAHTEGNPFFMTEVIRLLQERGELEEGSGAGVPVTLGIPQGVLEVIGQRLNRLSQECQGILTTAAVIGRQFDFRLLAILSEGSSETQLLESVDEALDAYLIQEVPGQGDVYQFSHALVQQTLREWLSTSRRVRLHSRIGETLETLCGDQPGDQAAELAHHFSEASSVLGTEKLVRYSLLAGEQALSRYAWEEALAHFQRALSAKDVPSTGSEPAEEAETAALLYGLGRAQLATRPRHETHTAVALLRRAFDYYSKAGDIARALVVAENPTHPIVGTPTGAAHLVFNALELVSPESHEAGRLWSRYGRVIGTEEASYDDAQEALSRALEIARREGDSALEMQTLLSAALVEAFHLQWHSAIQNAATGIELASQTDDPFSEVLLRFYTACGQFSVGDLEGARQQARAMLSPAEKMRTPFLLAAALWSNEMVYSLSGDWQSSRMFSDRGLAVAPQDVRLLITRALSEYEVGDFDQASVYLQRLLDVMRVTAPGATLEFGFAASATLLAACITGDQTRIHVGETAAGTILSSPAATPFVTVTARVGLALVAAQRSDALAAREQYEALVPAGGTILLWSMAVDRLLGLLAHTMGDGNLASDHFETALAFCRDAGYRPELAWTCHDYAEALLQRGNPGDLETATSLLSESLAISTELGMRPLMDRVITLQKRAEAQPVRAPAYPDGLTQREVEVLRLIAASKTDREIAEELVISLRTVTTHVGNILNKTGCANRAGATAYAIRQGLA